MMYARTIEFPDHRQGCRTEGAVLIIAMLIVIVLTGLVIVFARSVRVEALATDNQLAALEARAIALGAARAVMVLGDELPTDAVEVGTGAFWLIQPNFEDDKNYAFGIVDESAKINLNSASEEMLLALPSMDEAIVGAILDWRDEDNEPSPNGAESDYYLRLADPYMAKNEGFETVEELLLVRGVTAVELYGEDKNRNGILDDNENDASESEPPDNRDGRLDRGLFDFVTVYSSESGDSLVDVNGGEGGRASGPGGTGPGGGGPGGGGPGGSGPESSQTGGDESEADEELRKVLSEAADEGSLSEDRVDEILQNIISGRPHANMVDLFYKSGMTIEEFNAVHNELTTSGEDERNGLINVSSAPKEVLMALLGLEESDADALVGRRLEADCDRSAAPSTSENEECELASVAWITEVLERDKAVAIGNMITAKSPQRSVDIVAVSSGGRAFERYRMVYDTSGEEPRVLLWQRLTHLGWPLDPEILEALHDGKPFSELVQTTDRGSF